MFNELHNFTEYLLVGMPLVRGNKNLDHEKSSNAHIQNNSKITYPNHGTKGMNIL